MKSKSINGISSSLKSRLMVLLNLLVILFVAETIIMFILPILNLRGNAVVENFADSFMLAIFCCPFIWKLISRRKQVEDQLRKLSLAVEQSPGSIVITDLGGTIEYVNSKFTQVTGYAKEEVIGQNPRILKSGNTDLATYTELWRTIISGREWQGELLNKKKNGDLFWEAVKISPISNADGKVTHYMGIKEDVTARKRAEKMLQIEQQRLMSLLESLPGFVVLQSPDHTIQFTNRYFRERFGTVHGRPCYQIFHGRDEPCEICLIFQVFMNDESSERDAILSDGRPYHVYGYPFTDIDGTRLVMQLGIDISEQKRAEKELNRAYSELKATQSQLLQQEKMASIGQLAAGVAHEINNPIGFVTSNLRSLEKYLTRLTEFICLQSEKLAEIAPVDIAEDVKAKRKSLKLDYIMVDAGKLINESLEGTDRVRKIVQDLKTFSRLDEAEQKYVDINECLESTINIVWNEIKYNATLNKELSDVPRINCFPQQLSQVFMNLLVNASHAIENQGEITLTTWNDNGFVNVSIADTGCGIPEEIQRRIFEPFFTTKEVGKGTGLGLSISYDIIRKHGGNITVDSVVGKGSKFTVSLPLAISPGQNGT